MSSTSASDHTSYDVYDKNGRPFRVKVFPSGLVEVSKNVHNHSANADTPATIVMSSAVPDPAVYKVHDNGGRPFCVKIFASGLVEIWKNEYQKKTRSRVLTSLVVSYPSPKVWIGYSPDTRSTRFSGGNDSQFDGNSFLLQPNVDVLEYVFVGERIYSFTTTSPIVAYWSPVGNSDVPYPYAVDNESRHYLMLHQIVLTNCHSHERYSSNPDKFCPYDYYYGHGYDWPAARLLKGLSYLAPKSKDQYYVTLDTNTTDPGYIYWRSVKGFRTIIKQEEVQALVTAARKERSFAEFAVQMIDESRFKKKTGENVQESSDSDDDSSLTITESWRLDSSSDSEEAIVI